MKIESLQPGMVVYDVKSYTMGNTTRRSKGVWYIRIVSVDLENQTVMASWNTNPVERFTKRRWSKWRLKKPLMTKTSFGAQRLATKDEVKAHKAKLAEQNARHVGVTALADPMGAME